MHARPRWLAAAAVMRTWFDCRPPPVTSVSQPCGEGVGAEVLELAHLVAAAAEAGEVVPLHPQPAGGQPELRTEARPSAAPAWGTPATAPRTDRARRLAALLVRADAARVGGGVALALQLTDRAPGRRRRRRRVRRRRPRSRARATSSRRSGARRCRSRASVSSSPMDRAVASSVSDTTMATKVGVVSSPVVVVVVIGTVVVVVVVAVEASSSSSSSSWSATRKVPPASTANSSPRSRPNRPRVIDRTWRATRLRSRA